MGRFDKLRELDKKVKEAQEELEKEWARTFKIGEVIEWEAYGRRYTATIEYINPMGGLNAQTSRAGKTKPSYINLEFVLKHLDEGQ